MADLLEYVIRVRGGPTAAAEVRGLRKEFRGLAAEQRAVGTSGALAAKGGGKLSSALGILSKGGKSTVAILAAIGFEATKMNNKFDTQMTQVGIISGKTQKQLQGMRNSILDLAKPTGSGPADLAEAMAHLAKIDLPGVNQLTLLRAAADGAGVGLANVVETTDTLAGAMKVDMPGMSKNARTAMAQLVTAAQTGNMSLTDFNHAMGTGILPVAKNYGLRLTDITGALSVFTDEHMQGSSAMAQLATSFHFLTGATAKGEDALERIGLSGSRLAQDMRGPRGLQTALAELRSHLDAFSHGDKTKANAILAQILPGGRGRILQVLMNQLDNYGAKMTQQEHGTNRFEESVRKLHQSAAFKLKSAWAGVQADMIRMGQGIRKFAIPALLYATNALGWLLTALMAAPGVIKDGFQWFKNAGPWIHIAAEALGLMTAQIVLFLAVRKGILLTKAAIFAVRGSILAMRAAFILFQLSGGPLILLIMALVTVAILVATHWKQTKAILASVWSWMKNAAGAAFNWLKGAVTGVLAFIKQHWRLLAITLAGPVGLAVVLIHDHLGQVVHFVASMPGRIKNAAVGMFDGIIDAFKSAINWVLRAWNGLHLHIGIPHKIFGLKIPGGGHGVTLNTPDVPLLANGGTMRVGGAAVVGDAGPELLDLPTGAQVTPLGQRGRVGGDIVIKVDGKTLARVYHDQILEAQARGA